MASIVANMGLATVPLVTEKLDSKLIPTMVMLDNVNGTQDHDITFNDNFTPDVTNGVPTPTPQVIPRLTVNVAKGECISTQDILKDVQFLGSVTAVPDATDALCTVTFAYHFDDGDYRRID